MHSSPLVVDSVRDYALAVEDEQISVAYRLMKLCSEARPNGPFIAKKLHEYSLKLS